MRKRAPPPSLPIHSPQKVTDWDKIEGGGSPTKTWSSSTSKEFNNKKGNNNKSMWAVAALFAFMIFTVAGFVVYKGYKHNSDVGVTR